MAGIELVKKSDLTQIENEISGLNDSVSSVTNEVEGKSDNGHTHDYSEIENTPTIPSIDGLVTEGELQTALNGKADTVHNHSYEDLTNKPTIPDISGLATKSEVGDKANQSDLEALETLVANLQDEIEALKNPEDPEEGG